MTKCDECGAPLAEGAACREQFEFLLGHEFEDPALQAVHHLTVLCYSIHHPSGFDTSPEGYTASWSLLREAVTENLAAGELRRRNRARLRAGNRPLMRNRGRDHAALPPAPAWTYTVADVVNGPDGDYAGRVRAWAQTMVADANRDQLHG